MVTPDDYRNPKRKSGYEHVLCSDQRSQHDSGRVNRPYRAQYKSRPGKAGIRVVDGFGPRRATALKACWDYCNYKNGVSVQRRERASGRPDFYRDSSGRLHVDLPPKASSKAGAAQPKRAASPERAFIERIEARVAKLLQPGDFAEAKAGIGRQQIVTGVGQLKFRRFEAGKGRMFLVLPQRPSDPSVKWIASEGITLIVEGDENASSPS
jgi:hypothetical protein